MFRNGTLDAGARAVVMVTGHGLKDIDGVFKAVQQEPVVVENSLEAVSSVVTPAGV